ncbi:hypothetical protein [Halalkalibacillus halophilus]|uniref:hypothetical protein n=1 Tax=Halalkalibacillus halophilus TaxID=392827 RepID=UPI00040B4B97|nr:hypothetical protein [Halalkalibacillus halophilus]
MTIHKPQKINIWIQLLLLLFNIIFISFLIEELIDATEPNYGGLAFFTPIIALISLLYIRNLKSEIRSYLFRSLQVLNWFFIIFPFTVFIVIFLAFL